MRSGDRCSAQVHVLHARGCDPRRAPGRASEGDDGSAERRGAVVGTEGEVEVDPQEDRGLMET